MLVGFIWGKRYTPVQVLSVAMLTIGIIIAAMADAQSEVRQPSLNPSSKRTQPINTHNFPQGKSTSGPSQIDPSFLAGLSILALAQILSAIMGLYTQITYATYGSYWHENLFYSHFLSLPLFLPFLPSLRAQLQSFITSPPLYISSSYLFPSLTTQPKTNNTTDNQILPPIFLTPTLPTLALPKSILYLTLNALTQYLCIRGVNLLSARTTALGVTIVLNMRKLA
ncbi:MAG: hypothetical protein Q9181_006672, partial [Wetmoreana brouardii]